jgi:DNA-binding FrmR family transcriptional regulator
MDNKKEKITIALKKARTSLDKILLAIDEANDEQCFDLMQQNLAVIGLLKSANIAMLENHLDAHIDNMKNKASSEKKKMKQLRDEVVRIVKTAQNK